MWPNILAIVGLWIAFCASIYVIVSRHVGERVVDDDGSNPDSRGV